MKPNEVRAIRKRIDFTQIEFAESLFVSQQLIAHWERGRNVPSDYHMATLRQLRVVLDKDYMTVEDLRSVMKKSKTAYELLRAIF